MPDCDMFLAVTAAQAVRVQDSGFGVLSVDGVLGTGVYASCSMRCALSTLDTSTPDKGTECVLLSATLRLQECDAVSTTDAAGSMLYCIRSPTGMRLCRVVASDPHGLRATTGLVVDDDGRLRHQAYSDLLRMTQHWGLEDAWGVLGEHGVHTLDAAKSLSDAAVRALPVSLIHQRRLLRMCEHARRLGSRSRLAASRCGGGTRWPHRLLQRVASQ